MFVSPTNTKRFTLYHMQESEIYIQDFYGQCSFMDWGSHEHKTRDKGKFYLCSKSIVYESDNKNVPLSKHRFEQMKTMPTFTADGFSYTLYRTTTIKVIGNSPPQPFHVVEEPMLVEIWPSYESVKNLQDWVRLLHERSQQKANYSEQQIYQSIINKFNKKAFNKSLIESVSQKAMLEQSNVLVRRVLPLNHLYGYLFLTDEQVYFEPFHSLAGNVVDKIPITIIQKLFRRRYELQEIGLQIITDKGLPFYFTFETEQYRNRIYSILAKRVPQQCVRIDQLENITLLWQTKQISNYEYLMHLNQAGNRSFCDLSQYPIFPWVLCDYDSPTLDLKDPKVYRDLSKPIGAINEERLKGLLTRYEGMQPPRFMYGSHYSTPGYVIGYLVRKKPQYMLKLQSGRFDKPDRLFKCIKDDWTNVMENPTSLKELIPEFYQDDPSFLTNYQGLDLGVRQNKKRVGDVRMPNWAKDSPEQFLKIMRGALESEYVSNNLHNWIDLIFGYKQRGQEAIKAYNLFHPLTYEGMVDIKAISDPLQKLGIKCQINQFGQCPKQIFKIAHPSRNSIQPIFADKLLNKQEEEEDKSSEDTSKDSYTSPPINIQPVKYMEPSGLYSEGKAKVKTVMSMGKESEIKVSEIPRAHKSSIVRAVQVDKANMVLTIGQDGFLKIFDVYDRTCAKSFKICDFTLSCIAVLRVDEIYAIGSWDNNIYLFNTVYGSKSKPFPAHDNSVIDIIFLPRRKTLVSASWDCSIKMFRYVGSVLDNPQHFYDHENQLASLAANPDESIIAFGDIEGQVSCVSIEEKEVLFTLNINSQKIIRTNFIQNCLIAAAETEVRLLDMEGMPIASYQVDKNNGTITDIELDNEHLLVLTSKKQFILYDILQQKKIGNFFNDFTFSEKDKLPGEKALTCCAVGNDGLFIMIGGASGNIYVLRS